MFSFPTPSVYQTSKCFVTYGTMGHPDVKQLPNKVKPWSTLLCQDYIHKVDLILPEELLHLIKDSVLGQPRAMPSYYRVIMTLRQILEGEFFTQYIKIGNIMMLSEGKIDRDNVFTLKDGTLTLYLDKETYERAGLVGKLYGVKGGRGLKLRWVVQYDLRSPSALHGKKGFDRLVYACKNALNKPVTWLFYDLSRIPVLDPLLKHFPTKYTSNPAVVYDMTISTPPLKAPQAILTEKSHDELEEYATDIYEWLSMVRLESPRVKVGDDVDPYLSTYSVPGEKTEMCETKLCKVSWQGFMPPSWATQTLAELIQALPSKAWFSFSTTPFTMGSMGQGADCTFLRPPNSPGEYFLWEIKGHE
ncbi:ribonuclease P 40kDa subunit [Xylariaceae sp. FL0255]|nr:ribonuclease P 40kDa subunit [Xylariaceae sp. FL0255]